MFSISTISKILHYYMQLLVKNKDVIQESSENRKLDFIFRWGLGAASLQAPWVLV